MCQHLSKKYKILSFQGSHDKVSSKPKNLKGPALVLIFCETLGIIYLKADIEVRIHTYMHTDICVCVYLPLAGLLLPY